MSPNDLPILYANDSCPYVFRARIALAYAGIDVEHREVDLDNKPPALLQASPKATVPVLILSGGAVIDESWAIIRWAMRQDDPDNWCGDNDAALELAEELANLNDSEFGEPSMYYKFSSYYPDRDRLQDRSNCEPFLDGLEARLATQAFMYGNALSAADVPVYPAVAGFAGIEPTWFADRFPNVNAWLKRVAASPHVQRVDFDHEPWRFEHTG
ncbi:MAG: glutathione S-transferase family protein [Pseudomonadota bacterium]